MTDHATALDIHGFTVRCEADSDAFAEELVRPLRFFRRDDASPLVTIVVHESDPPYDRLPQLEAQFSTPRNVVYRNGKLKVVDYFGKGATLYEAGSARYEIYSRDRNLLCEAFYLLVLSLLGQYCDEHGLLRVHALALSSNDRAFLLMIPQGGGKSTMAFRLLAESQMRLISDDDPIISARGEVLPFPRALGVLDRKKIADVADEHVYSVDRMEFGMKYFIDVEHWNGRIETRPITKATLFVTRRLLNGSASIVKASKRKAMASLMRDAVFGVGLYQGVEFMFSHSSWEALAKGTTVMKRMARAARLVAASDVYELTLSGNVAENCRVFQEFVGKL